MDCKLCVFILIFGIISSEAARGRPRRCPPPPRIKNGLLKMTHRGMRIQYSCKAGFEIAGMEYVSCNMWGRWNRFPPACVARGCYRLSTPSNGNVDLSHGGAVARFTCMEGYLLKGAKSLTCDGQSWNGTVPHCIVDKYYKPSREENSNSIYDKPVKYYPHNPTWAKRSHENWLEEADYSCVGQGNYVPAPDVPNASPFTKFAFVRGRPKLFTIYRCKFGYILSGEQTHLYCVKGEWIGNRPKCVEKHENRYERFGYYQGDAPSNPRTHDEWVKYADYTCIYEGKGVSAPDIENAVIIPRADTVDGLPHLYVEYECNPGYSLSGPNKYLYCREERWLGEKPQCRRGGNNNRRSDIEKYGPVREQTKSGCDVNNGGCDQLCSDNWGRIQCSCKKGWQLDADGKTCIDVDECQVRNGGCSQYCLNQEGSFTCSCRHGYILAGNKRGCRRTRNRRLRYKN